MSGLIARAGAELFALAITAVAAVLVVRTVGPFAAGELAIGTTCFYLLTVLVNGGLSSAGAQVVASHPAGAAGTVVQVAKLRLIYAIVVVALTEVVVAVLPLGDSLRVILGAIGLGVVVVVLKHEWVLVGMGSVRAAAATRVVAATATLTAAALVVAGATSPPFLVLTVLAGPTAAALASTALALRLLRVRAAAARPDLGLRSLARVGTHYARADVSIFVYNNSDRLFLYLFGGAAVVGIYDAAYKLIQPFSSIGAVVGDTMFLRLARALGRRDEHVVIRRYLDLMMVATVPVGFLFAVVGPEVVALVYGDEFAAAGPLLALLGWVVSVGYLSGVLAIPFSAWQAPRQYGNAITAGSIANLVLNATLIPPLLATGAAVATIVAKLVVAAAAIRPFRSMSTYPVFRDFARYCTAATSGLVAAWSATAVGFDLIATVGVFGITYLVGLAVILRSRPAVDDDQRALERGLVLETAESADVPGGESQP